MNKFVKDLKEYVTSKGWNDEDFLVIGNEDGIAYTYFTLCKKGEQRNLQEKWKKDPEKMDKYLLEYLGKILRKHKITRIKLMVKSINQKIGTSIL